MNRPLLVIICLLIILVVGALLFSDLFAPPPDLRDTRAGRDGGAALRDPDAPRLPPGTFTGVVVSDLTKKPIAGAVVRADFASAFGPVEARDITDEEGAFRLEKLPPGEDYRVAVFAETYATVALPGQVLPSGETVDLGTIGLTRPVKVVGRVIDVNGRPIGDASVIAMPNRDLIFGGNWLGLMKTVTKPARPLEEVKTDNQGRFELTTLAEGRYGIQARARGYSPGVARDILAAPGPQHAPVEIILERGGVLEGIVEDSTGTPIEGAEVALDTLTAFLDAFQGRQATTTDENGRFVFGSVSEGMYIVATRSAGHPLAIRAPVRVPMRGKLKIRLAGSARLTGIVKNQAGEGIPGAQVMAGVGLIGWGVELVETDETGQYVIPNLPTGPLMFLSVNKEGYAAYPEGPLGGRGRPSVNLAAGEETRFDVTLRNGARVSGKILTSDGRPISGANVRVISGQTSMLDPTTTVSREDGSYSVGGVGMGRAVVLARAAGFTQDIDPENLGAVMSRRAQLKGASGSMVIIGPKDEDVTCDIVLKAACSVGGRVLDPEGKPVAGARVGLAAPGWQRFFRGRMDISGGASAQTVADENGEYLLVGIHAGKSTRLEASASGYAPGESAPLHLTAGQTIMNIDLTLKAGGKIAGIVNSAAGDPVPGALVRVAPAGQEWALIFGSGDPEPVRTDAQGRFEKTVYGNDEFSVRVDADGYVSSTLNSVKVEPGGAVEDLEVSLAPALTVAGTVIGPDGEPVSGAFVRGRSEGGRRGFENNSVLTDAQGGFILEGLDVGKYTIIVQSSLAPEQRVEKIPAGTEGLLVRLPAGLRIVGRVLDESGAPVIDVTLRARKRGSRGARVNTDENGAFRFENLGAGEWTVSYQPQQGDVDPYLPTEVKKVMTGTSDLVITLARGLDVMGTVLSSVGTPEPGVAVMLTSKGDRRSTMTDQNGQFTFGGLPEKTWSVTATGSKGGAGRVDGVASGELDVVIQLTTSLSIDGRVVGPDGRPPTAPVYVAVTPEGSDRAVSFVTSDIDGSFVFSGLAPGRYELKSGDMDGTSEGTVMVNAGARNVVLKLVLKEE